MTLKPMSQTALTAANLRRIARDLILQAEALEALEAPEPRRKVEFEFAPKRKTGRKPYANRKTKEES